MTTNGPTAPQAVVTAGADRRIRMCLIVTVDITIQNLCRGRLEWFTSRGFDITVVCAPTPIGADIEARGVRLHTAPLARSITPLKDLAALWNLYRFLRREQFDLIEVSTPKASLIGAMAARLAGARRVVHLLRGLVYHQQGGLTARLLRWSHQLACRFSHRVISISESMLEQACQDKICTRDKIVVLGRGSSNGVDLQRFSSRFVAAEPDARRRLGMAEDAVVVGFVGRMTGDKGLAELVTAFASLSEKRPGLYLLMVGDLEDRDRPAESIVERIGRHPRIRHVGWQSDVRPFMSAMDFLVLPSYREGFGTVLLEAAAMGLPLVTTDAVGGRDVVIDGKTGFCVPVRDSGKLEEAMMRLASDEGLRSRMGEAARHVVEQHYDCAVVWALQEQEFHRLLQASN